MQRKESDGYRWVRTEGVPVYGIDAAAAPPDPERPFVPPSPRSQDSYYTHQNHVEDGYTGEQALQLSHPHHDVPDDPAYLWPAWGPAMTPDDRAAWLHSIREDGLSR